MYDLVSTSIGFLGLAWAIYVYICQKRRDRDHKIREIKIEVYRKYICAVLDEFGYRGKDNEKAEEAKFEIVRRRAEMLLTKPSQEIVHSVTKLSDLAPKRGESEEKLDNFINELALCVVFMGEDGFHGDKITVDEAKRGIAIRKTINS